MTFMNPLETNVACLEISLAAFGCEAIVEGEGGRKEGTETRSGREPLNCEINDSELDFIGISFNSPVFHFISSYLSPFSASQALSYPVQGICYMPQILSSIFCAGLVPGTGMELFTLSENHSNNCLPLTSSPEKKTP